MSDEAQIADVEAECALIGATFERNDFVFKLEVTAADFTDPHNRFLWEVAVDNVTRGGVFAVAPLAREYKNLAEYVRALVGFGGTAVLDPAPFVARVRDASMRRRMKTIGEELAAASRASGTAPSDAICAALRELSSEFREESSATKRATAEAVFENLRHDLPCFATGMPSVDAAIGGGLFAGKLYGIAARKKVGKTVLLGTLSHNLNRVGVKHLFVCCEMSPEEIEHRNMAREFGINSMQFLRRSPDLASKVGRYVAEIPDMTTYVYKPGATLEELQRIVGNAIAHARVCGVILDYWQLVQGRRREDTEEFHLRRVAQWLADLSRRERLWVVTAAQVNQDGNTRGSEGLKLACDMYFTLHREKEEQAAWLEMEESRFTPYVHVGNEESAGLLLNKRGPWFEDAAAPLEEPAMGAPRAFE